MELVAYGEPLGPGRADGPGRPGARRGARAPRAADQPPGRPAAAGPPGPPDLRRRGAGPHPGPARPCHRRVPGRRRRSGRRPAPRRRAARGHLAAPRRGRRAATSCSTAPSIARWRYDFPLAERLARAAADAGAGLRRRPAGRPRHRPPGPPRRGRGRTGRAWRREADDDAQRGQVAIARFDHVAAWRRPPSRRPARQRRRRRSPTPTGATASRPGGWRRCSTRRAPRAAADAARALVARARGDALVFACLFGAYGLVRARPPRRRRCELSARGAAARQDVGTPLAWYPLVAHRDALHGAAARRALRRGRRAHRRAPRPGAGRGLGRGPGRLRRCWRPARAASGAGSRPRRRRAREALAVHQRLGPPVLVRQRPHRSARWPPASPATPTRRPTDLAALDDLGLPPAAARRGRPAPGRGPGPRRRPATCPRRRSCSPAPPTSATAIGDRVGEAAALHGLARLGRADEVSEPAGAGRRPHRRRPRPGAGGPRRGAGARRRAGASTRCRSSSRRWVPTCSRPRRQPTRRSPAAGTARCARPRRPYGGPAMLAERGEEPVDAGAAGGRGAGPAHPRRAGDGRPRRHRPLEQGDRRPPRPVDPHGREPAPARLREARHLRPRRAGRRAGARRVSITCRHR